MESVPQIVPQEGKLGMTVNDLVFHKHEMAYGAEIFEDALKTMPPSTQESMDSWTKALKTTKHAVVKFPNGATASIITGVPQKEKSGFGFGNVMFAKADERVPTYEISFSIPGRDSIILNYQTPDEVNGILDELARLPA